MSTPTFEQALKKIEDIVKQMENGSLNLDDSLRAYREALQLIKHCRQTLANTETEIRTIEKENFFPDKNGKLS